jgi:capsid protein
VLSLLMSAALSTLATAYDVSPAGVHTRQLSVVSGQLQETTDHGLKAGEYFSFENSGYDAIVDKGRRKPSSALTMAEDRHLNAFGRRLLIGNTRDLLRNFCLVHWAIRRHLDYVASFRFESTTGNHAYDRDAERVFDRESRAENTDISGRFSLRKLTRLQELLAVVDGDVGWLRVARGTGRLQLIESDRVRSPYGLDTYTDDGWINGIRCDEAMSPLEYGIYKRVYGGTALQFERTIPASQMRLRGYWHRVDQVRGVSPLASAVNSFRDAYEGFDAALIQAKVAALFGLQIKRWSERPIGDIKEDDAATPTGGYDIDLSHGAFVLDLDPGDAAEFLHSGQPSTEWQAFMQLVLMVALKSVDIPYSFLDEGHTNFFGSRGAWLLYDRSAEDKREDNAEALDYFTEFKYRRLIAQRRLSLPKTADGRQLTVDDHPWQHVARKAPWWRPLEEVQANLKAIGGGLTSPQKVCQESDQGDFYENVDAIADAIAYAKDKGVTLAFQVPEFGAVPQPAADDPLPPARKK